ncbi:MAG TPA: hypothetical protein VLN47_03665, partial [Clostridiaceae bacterium]|nr:hypothetical protein [Clostridiaceae bacterium]
MPALKPDDRVALLDKTSSDNAGVGCFAKQSAIAFTLEYGTFLMAFLSNIGKFNLCLSDGESCS